MMRRNERLLAFLVGLSLTISAAVVSVHGQSSVTVDPTTGLISLESRGVPLQELLEQISAATPFGLLRLQQTVHQRPVEVSISGVSVKRAVVQVMKAADVSFAIFGPDSGLGLRVVGGDPEFVQTSRLSDAPVETSFGERVTVQGQVQSKKANDPELENQQNQESSELTGPTNDAPTVVEQREQLFRTLVGDGMVTRRQGTVLLPFLEPNGGHMTAYPAPPGTIIELPFPGPDGARLTAVVPPQGMSVQLPFPPSSPPR